jgi:hypothetical protein
MIFAAIVWGKRINVQSISNHGFTPSLLKLTARQLREFALPGAIHRLIIPVANKERIPVGRQVWRNFCNHGELKEFN